MDPQRRARPIVIASAAITLAAAAFAVGAAVSSDDGSGSAEGAAPSLVTAASRPAPAGTADDSATPSRPVTTATGRFDIGIAGFRFGPQEAVVQVGTEVVWTNADSDVHSIVAVGERFASSETFSNGESYAVVFTEPGTYEYSCGVHPSMSGTIVVEA